MARLSVLCQALLLFAFAALALSSPVVRQGDGDPATTQGPEESPLVPDDGTPGTTPAPGDSPSTPGPAEPTLSPSPSASASPPTVPTETPDLVTPSPSPEEPICFPGSATVELVDGSVKRMEDIQIGERVMVGTGKYSDVFMFTHKLSDVSHAFITLRTASGHALTLTNGHQIYANDVLVAAGRVQIGDTLQLADGSKSVVESVQCSTEKGLFNPQTLHGDIVVNGILASTYTSAVTPKYAHALLTPFRFVYERLGLSTRMLDAGADAVAKFLSPIIA